MIRSQVPIKGAVGLRRVLLSEHLCHKYIVHINPRGNSVELVGRNNSKKIIPPLAELNKILCAGRYAILP